MNQAVREFIERSVLPEDLLWNEPMKKHTTFRVGGEAQVFIKIRDEENLKELLSYFHKVDLPYFILGKGSNLLVSDAGFEGAVLDMTEHFTDVLIEGTKVIAKAGAMLPQVATMAANAGLSGMEFASGIPGTIGGAIVMNAGAYDGEMKQIVKSVSVLTSEGEILELDNETMEFGYRTSIIKNRPFTVLEVVFELTQGNKEEILKKGADFNQRRREKQPLEYPSAGSTFKRPEGYFAGKLIMDAGLRGFRIGGAQVSEKHCGFVINVGNATAADIFDLMNEIRDKVKDQFGVTLEPEVVKLGEF